MLFGTLCPSSFAIILTGKRELVAFLNCLPGVLCSVALPRGAVGWTAVCDCGIYRSYSLVVVFFLVGIECMVKLFLLHLSEREMSFALV